MKLYQKVSIYGLYKAFIHKKLMIFLCAKVEILKQNKSLTAVIEAHTDGKGSDAYNQNLSDRRAVSVINALKALDINTSRLKSIGYGESQPIATNDTEAGKAINRRVTALVNQ